MGVTLVQFQEILIFPIDFNDFINSSGHFWTDLGSHNGSKIIQKILLTALPKIGINCRVGRKCLHGPIQYQGFAFHGKNKSKIEREFLYTSSDRFDNVPDRIRAVRDAKFKYIRNYNPENSHALNVLYRKQMLLMRHLTSLHLTGQLDEKSDNWFKSPRLMEELYDLENDPFELNNLSLDPNYTDIKKKLSLNLDEFLLKIDDLGRIPEKELIKLISSED